MKKNFLFLLLLLLSLRATATHLLGGYIQVKRTSTTSLAYEFTVNVLMDPINGSSAISGSAMIPFCFGDGSEPVEINQVSLTQLSPDVVVAVYKTTHVYNGAGSGSYTASALISNRSNGIRNVPDAVDTPLLIKTTFVPTVTNSTPIFAGLTARLTGTVYQQSVFNYKGTDADGDSVAHYLVRVQKGGCNESFQPIAGYQFPNEVARRGTFKIDANSGQLTWNAPTEVGVFDFAVVAEEWRHGQKISETLCDMVVFIDDKPGGTPVTVPPYEPVLERNVLTSVDPPLTDQVSIAVYPIPAQDQVQVQLKSPRPTKATFRLIDVQGRVVQERNSNGARLQHEQSLEARQLAPGVYLLQTITDDRHYTTKILKR